MLVLAMLKDATAEVDLAVPTQILAVRDAPDLRVVLVAVLIDEHAIGPSEYLLERNVYFPLPEDA